MIALLIPLHNNLVWDPPVFARAPEERAMFAESEARAFQVTDSRSLVVESEARRFDVAEESRSFAVEPEVRRF